MGNIATCANGHNYDTSVYQVCPYCPKNQTGERPVFQTKTSGSSETVSHSQKTVIASNEIAGKTVISQPVGQTVISAPAASRITLQKEEALATERKLSGFLVSYDQNPYGRFYQVYEGKNVIGTEPVCDIVITGDPAVSGKHMTILHRSGVYRFKDEFSEKGTLINGQMKEEGVLADKDIIRLGNTKFVFLSIPADVK